MALLRIKVECPVLRAEICIPIHSGSTLLRKIRLHPFVYVSKNRLLTRKANRVYLPLHRIIYEVRFWEAMFDFRDQVVYFGVEE